MLVIGILDVCEGIKGTGEGIYLPSCACVRNARDKGIVEVCNVDPEIVKSLWQDDGQQNSPF